MICLMIECLQGEEYKLFWPDQPEFVRMAARFGATIIPFGVVGEDDLAEVSRWLIFYVETHSVGYTVSQ